MTGAVIGIGNPDCGDDAAGHRVVQQLRGRLPAAVRLESESGEAASLLARIEGEPFVFLVDACTSGATPGAVHRFDASGAPLPAGRHGLSTHGVGLAEALELARALGTLPARCIVYAIEGIVFAVGAPVSAAVAAAVPLVANRLCDEVAAVAAGSWPPHA
jgi:hydrogenase maturation protease